MINGPNANPILDKTFRTYMANPLAQGFVCTALFPVFETGQKSAQYFVFDKESMLNIPTNIQRSPGSHYKRTVTKLSDDAFACLCYGIEAQVPDEIRAMYASAFLADRNAINRNAHIQLINWELRVKAKIDAANVPNSSPATKWNQAGSKPRKDVLEAKAALNENSLGAEANVMTISRTVRDILLEHPDVKENVKYTKGGNIDDEMLAAYFGIEKLVIAGTMKNGAADGQAAVAARIWGDDVMLAYVDPTASEDFEAATFGRSFRWTGVQMLTTYREGGTKSDIHQADDYLDEKITAADFGYKLSDVLA